MTTILIADDHLLVRIGLELVAREELGNCCIEFAASGEEVMEKLAHARFDMLFTDMNMPDTESVTLVKKALEIQPRLKILVVSVNPEAVFAKRFLQLGAFGYVQKNADDKELKNAIRSLSLGRKYISPTQADLFISSGITSNEGDSPFARLSTREMEVTMLLLKGYGAIEVAATLSVSPSTASTYRGRIFEKLGVKNTIDLGNLARQFHLLDGSLSAP